MEIIGPIASKLSDYVIDAIFHELGYLVYYKDNMKSLKERAENLVSARSRVQHLIDEAKDKAEDVEDDVHNWLTNVDEITQETYTFLIKIAEEEEKKCINGSCFNFIRRHRLSRKAKKMVEELAQIQKQGNFDKVSYRGSLPKFENISNYVTFESRLSIMEEVVEALKDPNVSMIGVHGMGGIGKTMLVTDVSCQVMNSKLFEPVIMATIGQNPNVKHIQGQLADMLSLSFDRQETERGRAALLQKRLQMEKSILIILDDIWNRLDLGMVGIPCGDDYKGCKILFTSRSIHVLSDEMNIEKNFEVKNLTEEESWNFFTTMMGKSNQITTLEWKKIAIDVAKKCGKLPIALATVAKALRGRRLHVWKDALRQLNNPATVNIEGVTKEVYASLKLSYDSLNCLEAKLLFLLCSIFPDDYDINKDILVRYVVGLKFLRGIYTLETTRDRIFTLVDDLGFSCLLQKSEKGSKYVKMHDVVRDVAIHIASNNDQICTLSYGKGLNMWQDEDTHGDHTTIFANCADFHDLPTKLEFPKLELLTLENIGNRRNWLKFPEEFFEGMEKLKVLHLRDMYLPQPPSSFHCMINLRTLLLDNCELENIDMIGELKNLEILHLSKSRIIALPSSLSQLSRLKELNLLHCSNLKVIPSQVISKLTKLEALLLSDIFHGWDKVEGSKTVSNVSLAELQHLPCLTTLYLRVRSFDQLPRNAFSKNSKLEEFKIIIDHNFAYFVNYKTNKVLHINMDFLRNEVDSGEGVRMLLKKAEELFLIGSFGVKDALLEFNQSYVLRFLEIQNDQDVEYLFTTTSDDNNEMASLFPKLEKLTLCNMRRLKGIIEIGTIKTVKVFENLKFMDVLACDNVKYLFPFSIMEALFNLQEINVVSCKLLEAIVVLDIEEHKAYKIECSQLRSLTMINLPAFVSFYCKIVEDEEPTNAEIVEDDQVISNLTPFDGQVGFPNLKILQIGDVENLWDNHLNVDYTFNRLETLHLKNCENVESILTHNTMIMLKELRALTVDGFDSLEQVFDTNEISLNEGDDVIPFPSKLEELVLKNLPNLKHVWKNVKDPDQVLIIFPSLTRVEVFDCPKLRGIFPTPITKHLHQLKSINITDCGIKEIFSNGELELEYSKVSFPNLQSLRIISANYLEMIWQNGLVVDDLSKLKYIELEECNSLKNVVALNEMRLLKELEELSIRDCDSLTEIFKIYQKLPHPQEDTVSFKLKSIVLRFLPNLKEIWSKDFDGIYHFPNFNDWVVYECPKLRNPLLTV